MSAKGESVRLFMFVASVCVLVISGCSSSVHPLLTDVDLAHDINLDGTWTQIGPPDAKLQIPRFTCQGFDDHSGYDVTLLPVRTDTTTKTRGKEIPREYEMRIGKLGGDYYLQLARSEQISGGPAFFEGVVTYTWAKVVLEDSVLKIYPVDDGALERLLPKSRVGHLMHKPSDFARNIVITESTAKLQDFFAKHHTEVFSKTPLSFRRTAKEGG